MFSEKSLELPNNIQSDTGDKKKKKQKKSKLKSKAEIHKGI